MQPRFFPTSRPPRVPIWATATAISGAATLLLLNCNGCNGGSNSSSAPTNAASSRAASLNVHVTDGFSQNDNRSNP